MPAVMQQVDALSLSDKMRMMYFLVKSIELVVQKQEAALAEQKLHRDFSRFSGRWTREEGAAFDEATARSVDEGQTLCRTDGCIEKGWYTYTYQ